MQQVNYSSLFFLFLFSYLLDKGGLVSLSLILNHVAGILRMRIWHLNVALFFVATSKHQDFFTENITIFIYFNLTRKTDGTRCIYRKKSHLSGM